MNHLVRSFIDGEYRDAAQGRSRELINPATEKPFITAQIATEEDVDVAMQAAQRAFAEWRLVTPSERSLALLRFADAIEARADELVAAECENTGKPLALTLSEEIGPMVDQIRYFAGAARNLEGRASAEYMAGMTSSIRREPVGVCAQITPWNYPMMMAVWKFAPAIAAGNAVVLKPASTTPVTSVLLAEIAAPFFPPGTLNVVVGDRATGTAIVRHPIAAMASITGSVRAGIEVAKDAADDVKRVHLELGGKAPVVVFADCDVDNAVESIATAGYFNAGQDCTAATRVLVGRHLHDEFVARLAARAEELVVGGPEVKDAFYGPLNSSAQFDTVAGFIDRLPSHAQVVTGGRRVGEVGFCYAPTVVAGVRPGDEIACKEVFGPVITVQPFEDEAEAIALANDVEYGLASSVFTSHHGTAMRVANALEFGCVWINTHIPLVAEMPHGGFGHSGYGKDLSMYGFEDYTRVKHVMSNITV